MSPAVEESTPKVEASNNDGAAPVSVLDQEFDLFSRQETLPSIPMLEQSLYSSPLPSNKFNNDISKEELIHKYLQPTQVSNGATRTIEQTSQPLTATLSSQPSTSLDVASLSIDKPWKRNGNKFDTKMKTSAVGIIEDSLDVDDVVRNFKSTPITWVR